MEAKNQKETFLKQKRNTIILLTVSAICAVLFIIVNRNMKGLSSDTFTIIWSWSIWLYLFIQMAVLTNSLRCMEKRKHTLLVYIDFLLLLVFFILYVYFYLLKVYDIGHYTLYILISIVLFEVTSSYFIYKTDYAFISSSDKLGQDEMKKFVQAKLMKIPISMTEERAQRITITIWNGVTALLVLITPMFADIIGWIFKRQIEIYFLMIILTCFILCNYKKYKLSGISWIHCLFDTVTCILGILYFTIFSHVYGVGSFIKIFISVYCILPFIITCDRLSKVYRYGQTYINKEEKYENR